MRQSKTRPNSSYMVPVKKHRAHKVPSDVHKLLNFDPWISMYKENFNKKQTDSNAGKSMIEIAVKPTSDVFNNPSVIKPRPMTSYRQNPQRDVLAVKINTENGLEFKNQGAVQPKAKMTNNFFKNGQKPEFVISQNQSNSPKIAVTKANSNVHNDTNTFGTENNQKTTQEKADQLPRFTLAKKTTESLLVEFPELQKINQTAPFQNILGQTEEWMDVKDKLNPAVHSKLVTHNTKEFLASNIRGLVNSQNEYYPFLTGKCLCNQCTCSKCRCVHFKYRLGQNVFTLLKPETDESTTEYKREFVPKKMRANPAKTNQNEIQVVPSKVNYSTSASLNYGVPSKTGYNTHNFPIRAKMDNLGANVCPVFCGINSNTSYKNDYPDWKCLVSNQGNGKERQLPAKTMPFMGKAVNREYGAFHNLGDVPGPRAP